MAQYKVPQDVEAEDKLLGPFSFRQFVYLLIAGGLCALAVGLAQIFPLLALIPVPFILFFVILALPLKKDQPMETYIAALLSYYTKPRVRKWEPGQSETLIEITAPKVVEQERTRNITGEEATNRLSFLANIVDSGGYAIKEGTMGNSVKDEYVAEANATTDMFETPQSGDLGEAIMRDETVRHNEMVQEMQNAILKNEQLEIEKEKAATVQKHFEEQPAPVLSNDYSSIAITPSTQAVEKPVEKVDDVQPKMVEKMPTAQAKSSIIELANNPDYSVATIAKEANRIHRKDEGEVFISLH